MHDLEEKRIMGGERPLITERRERERTVHRGLHKKTSPKPMAGKMKEVDYCQFLQPGEFQD